MGVCYSEKPIKQFERSATKVEDIKFNASQMQRHNAPRGSTTLGLGNLNFDGTNL